MFIGIFLSYTNQLPCCLGLGLWVYCLGLGGNCLGLDLGLEPWCLGLGLGD